MISMQYSYQKLSQFLQVSNVLAAAVSNIDGSLERDMCIFSTKLNRPVWNKHCLSSAETSKWQEVFLSITNSITTRKQCASCSSF
jgi:hypothetical protein